MSDIDPKRMINDLKKVELPKWETGFMESMTKWENSGYKWELSSKQINVLNKIWTEHANTDAEGKVPLDKDDILF